MNAYFSFYNVKMNNAISEYLEKAINNIVLFVVKGKQNVKIVNFYTFKKTSLITVVSRKLKKCAIINFKINLTKNKTFLLYNYKN